MRFYKWTLIHTANWNQMHRRMVELRDENISLRNTVILADQRNEALEKKCELVNLAKMKNRIRELEREIEISRMEA